MICYYYFARYLRNLLKLFNLNNIANEMHSKH